MTTACYLDDDKKKGKVMGHFKNLQELERKKRHVYLDKYNIITQVTRY